MASSSSISQNGITTRLKEATEKRRAEEEMREIKESKRQKEMFTPRTAVGPRDIVVDSNLPKIKTEDNFVASTLLNYNPTEVNSTLIRSQENLVNSNFQIVKLEVDSNFVVKVEDILDLNESTSSEQSSEIIESVEQNDTNDEHEVTWLENINSESESKKCDFSQNCIRLLHILDYQKGQEINLLKDLIKELEYIKTDESSPTIDSAKHGLMSENAQVGAQLISDLKSKDKKIKMLSQKMEKVRDEIFGDSDNDVKTNVTHQSSEEPVQELCQIELVLPFLYPELQLTDLLNLREVCQYWSNAVDNFLDNHPSLLPFSTEAQLEEQRKQKVGQIPTCQISPLNKLEHKYIFSKLRTLKTFTDTKKGKVIGSLVWLDDIVLVDPDKMDAVEDFFKTFGVQIKHLKIRQIVPISRHKINRFKERIKLCLGYFPNLVSFTLVIGIGEKTPYRPNFANIFPVEISNLQILKVESFKDLPVFQNFLRSLGLSPTLPSFKVQLGLEKFAFYSPTHVFVYQI